ncbi:hypothetical protein FJZ23_02075 [Candidatus Parcubacteria bacterium]|nr:hypothetical protein [Candidatus Parcubacteria bacterium]
MLPSSPSCRVSKTSADQTPRRQTGR